MARESLPPVERIYFNTLHLRQCAIRKELSPLEK